MSTCFVALIVAAALSILSDQAASADSKNVQISKDLIECINQSEFYWELQNHAKIKEELSGAEAGRTEFYKWFAGQLKPPQLPTERQRTAEAMRDSAWSQRKISGAHGIWFTHCVQGRPEAAGWIANKPKAANCTNWLAKLIPERLSADISDSSWDDFLLYQHTNNQGAGLTDGELRIAWDERNSADGLAKHFVRCFMK